MTILKSGGILLVSGGLLILSSAPAPSDSFSLVSSGLIVADDFADISDWSNEASAWTVENVPLYIAYPTSNVFLSLGSGGSSEDGTIRQLACYHDTDGTLWLFYDATDAPNFTTSTAGVHLASSTDGGKTWTRHGRQLDPSGGYWARLNGFVFKDGSTYYLYSLADNPTGTGDGAPYLGSIFSASALTGTWTLVNDFPGVGSAGQWDAWSHYPYSVVLSSGTYYAFIGAGVTGAQRIGYDTASNPSGTYTKGGDTGLANAGLPENPKVWWDSVLNKWVMIANQVSGALTDKNRIFLSDSLTDWSAATFKDIQYATYGAAGTMDSAQGDVVGVGSPFYNLDMTVYRDGNYIPFTYDGLPTDGNHQGRKGLAGVLEASPNAAQCAANATPRVLRRTQSNSDFVAEFAIEIVSSAADGAASFQYRRDDSAAAISNGYDIDFTTHGGLALYKISGGSVTSIGSYATSLTATRMHRIRIEVSGSNHKVYVDGVLAINVTDATHSSGGAIAFRAYNVTMRVRNYHMRSSNTVTINGAPSAVHLLAHGGIYVTEHQTAITHTHYPLGGLLINGTLTDFPAGIYGGDIYEYNE